MATEPGTKPKIDPAYLSDPYDRKILRDGLRLVRHIVSQASFDPFRGEELSPGPHVISDAAIDAWVAATATA